MDPVADPGGLKTYGSYGPGSGSATLLPVIISKKLSNDPQQRPWSGDFPVKKLLECRHFECRLRVHLGRIHWVRLFLCLRRNCPPSPARECDPPPTRVMGAPHSLGGERVGDPIPTIGQKLLYSMYTIIPQRVDTIDNWPTEETIMSTGTR